MKRSILEKRAVRTGIRASRKRGHIVSREELLDLRVQALPNLWRVAFIGLGIALISACYFAWPSASGTLRGLEALTGVLSIFFGAFGVRRTLSQLLDTVHPLDAADLVGHLVEAIANAISDIDL